MMVWERPYRKLRIQSFSCLELIKKGGSLMAALFDDYGRWPVDPVDYRKKKEMVKISPHQWKHLVHGEKKHAHVSVIASTNYAQVGYIQLPPNSSSELE